MDVKAIYEQQNQFTKVALILSLVLLTYGYLCRAIDLYFFWESRWIGWIVLFIAVIGFLANRRRSKKKENKKTIWESIGIGLIIFGFFAMAILVPFFLATGIFEAASKYFVGNPEWEAELGPINNISIIPKGGGSYTSSSGETAGQASLHLTLKGTKKYKDVDVLLIKDHRYADWTVVYVE